MAQVIYNPLSISHIPLVLSLIVTNQQWQACRHKGPALFLAHSSTLHWTPVLYSGLVMWGQGKLGGEGVGSNTIQKPSSTTRETGSDQPHIHLCKGEHGGDMIGSTTHTHTSAKGNMVETVCTVVTLAHFNSFTMHSWDLPIVVCIGLNESIA